MNCRHRTLSSGEIVSEWDLLTWELDFKRTGAFSPKAQRLMFKFLADSLRTHGTNQLIERTTP